MQTIITRISQKETASIEEYVGWHFSAVLTGVQYKRKDSYWLAIIKANFRDGPKVCFIKERTLYSLLKVSDELVEAGTLWWYEDQPWDPTKRR